MKDIITTPKVDAVAGVVAVSQEMANLDVRKLEDFEAAHTGSQGRDGDYDVVDAMSQMGQVVSRLGDSISTDGFPSQVSVQ